MEASVADRTSAADLRLRESVSLSESAIDADGTVLLHVLRPCIGKGMGKHLYEADMLRRYAHVFKGWKMYNNHLNETLRRQRGGLPRDIEEIGGRIIESWWDPDVPATEDFGRGAILARVKPVGTAKRLIEEDPAILEASINADATGVRATQRDGRRVLLVEGIQDQGSVDWVSEGGAGGRLVELVEAVYHEQQEEEMQLLESLTDQELVEALRKDRPQLIETLVEGRQEEGGGEGGEGSGGEGAGSGEGNGSGGEGTPTPPPTLDSAALKEALTEVLPDLVRGMVREETGELRTGLEEARLDAEADSLRRIQLGELRDAAHKRIREARLPQGWTSDLQAKFSLVEGKPTADLDVLDDVDENAQVVKPASEKLAEAVDAEIQRARERLAEANPTRVRGQGPKAPKPENGEGGGGGESKREPAHWEQVLQEAGIDEPRDAYHLQEAGA